jgi:hypothetical protein
MFLSSYKLSLFIDSLDGHAQCICLGCYFDQLSRISMLEVVDVKFYRVRKYCKINKIFFGLRLDY